MSVTRIVADDTQLQVEGDLLTVWSGTCHAKYAGAGEVWRLPAGQS